MTFVIALLSTVCSVTTHQWLGPRPLDLQAPHTAPLSPNTSRAGCPCSSCANREPLTRGAACKNTHRRICSSFAAHAPIRSGR